MPYLANTVGAAAMVPSTRPGIFASPWGQSFFNAFGEQRHDNGRRALGGIGHG